MGTQNKDEQRETSPALSPWGRHQAAARRAELGVCTCICIQMGDRTTRRKNWVVSAFTMLEIDPHVDKRSTINLYSQTCFTGDRPTCRQLVYH